MQWDNLASLSLAYFFKACQIFVIKAVVLTALIWSHIAVLLKSNLDVQQTGIESNNKTIPKNILSDKHSSLSCIATKEKSL